MANTTLRITSHAFAGQTLHLFARDGATGAPSPAGYLLTAEVGTQNSFVATVADALTGDWYAECRNAAGVTIAGDVFLGLTDTATSFNAGAAAVDVSEIVSGVTAALSGVTVTVSSAIFDTASETLTVVQGDHYAGSPLRIDIDSADDLKAYKYILTAHLEYTPAQSFAVRMTILSDEVGQYAMFAPAASVTEVWGHGTYVLRHKIETGPNQFKSLGQLGKLVVRALDTPDPIVDVDPAA